MSDEESSVPGPADEDQSALSPELASASPDNDSPNGGADKVEENGVGSVKRSHDDGEEEMELMPESKKLKSEDDKAASSAADSENPEDSEDLPGVADSEQNQETHEKEKGEDMDFSSERPALDLSSRKPEEPLDSPSKNSVGGDSDKENSGETPMDLSRSKEEDEQLAPMVNGFSDTKPLSEEGRNYIRKLRDELRNEEAKLVLLKKIRQSQAIHHAPEASSAPPTTTKPAVAKPSVQQPLSQHRPVSQAMQRENIQKSSSQQMLSRPQAQQSAHRNNVTPSSQRPSNAVSGSGFRGSSAQNNVDHQTPAQRQAAAKLALRKQLEKTLLQIPPPKPPAPEMNFIPSLAGAEFMLLVGLEEVVKHIVEYDKNKENKGPEVRYVFNPFVCVQCGTDFTPVWKRDKPGSKNVICEQCVTSNQKKALKQEHTNRLKSAFVKALQQEQEIEQRIQTSSSSSSAAPAPSSSRSEHRSSAPSSSSSATSAAASTAPMNLSKVTPDQLRQHQNLLAAHQQAAQMRGAHLSSMGFNPMALMGYPFQPMPGATGSGKNADLQRQYLLDMIPRTLPGSNMLWRS